ncbi:MAG: STT3 domain-containing protein [Acidobacteriota bacterium]
MHSALLAACAFLIALALRLLNAPYAFESGKPVISPVDELYHWKRISFSAKHFPQVLEFDRDRGDGGAFCPWPPLYDLAAGGAARLLGAHDDDGVLARAVWFPPVVFAAFVAAAVWVVGRAWGAFTAIVAGAALASSPFLVTASWIGAIDHHFLEPALTFAILGACLADRRGIVLGAALTAAMFVQTALIIAAALAFAVLFFRRDGRAGAVGFGIAAIAIALYRLTRADGYPNSEWFLGWTHAALFTGAAVADGLKPVLHRAWALVLGGLVVLPVLPHLLQGAHFLGGDPWLRTIVEFQPLWRARGEDLLSIAVGLGAGAIFVWPLALRRNPIALFAIAYLLLTITSRRFWIVAIPLLALAGAVYAGKRLLPALLVAVVPPLQLAGWLMTPQPRPQVEIAMRLRALPPGRVLAPWSMGHAIDVLGRHAVIIDNFGSMPDPALFEAANAALAGKDLEKFCREHNVRYVIDPTSTLRSLPPPAARRSTESAAPHR